MHPVIPQWQVVGQHEAGLTDRAPVQVKRRCEVVDLAYPGADRPVLELQPHLGGMTVRHMHPEPCLGAGTPKDGRRQWARPVRAIVSGQRRAALQLGAGGHAERGEDGYQRGFRDSHPSTGPVLIVGGDSKPPREFDQRGRQLSHAAILLNQMTEMRPECSADGNCFTDLSLLIAVRCAVKFSSISPHY